MSALLIPTPSLRRLASGLGLSLGLLGCGPLLAENYALIMAIGNYSEPRANLPGIDLDAQNAGRIARTMGVPDGNMSYLSDRQLTVEGITRAFDETARKIRRGDNVFIYYSGHGGQDAAGGGKCSEGMVAYDMRMYRDSEMEKILGALSERAGQVVFMNDSCFSGGAAEFKALTRGGGDRVGKSWKLAPDYSKAEARSCGDPINAKLTRNLVPLAKEKGANLLYIAAAQDNEVADATARGSAATLAWLECINGTSDTDRSGVLTGEEIRQCAQRYLDQHRHNHHIALVGNKTLPVAFVDGPSPGYGGDPVAGAATLQDIRNGASPEIRVSLQTTRPRLKIQQDSLDFSVTTSKAGYLTILQVGSDGQTFNRLFPNDIDQNNYLPAGSVRLPRPSWQLKSGGPAGSSYLLAIVSDTPRDFAKGMRADGPFRTAQGRGEAKTLYAVATGAAGGQAGDPGRYGASDILAIQEF